MTCLDDEGSHGSVHDRGITLRYNIAQRLSTADLNDKKLECHCRKVDVGSKTERLLKELMAAKKSSEKIQRTGVQEYPKNRTTS